MPRSSTTYKSKWKSGETTVIRVPEVLVAPIMEYAKTLDISSNLFDFNTVRLFPESDTKKIHRSKVVNIASVPLRSPFRYPGGKTWLVPYIRIWLSSFSKPDLFIEPFAGGAIGSLTVAFEDLAEHVLFAETDPQVSAVWQTILSGQADWLIGKITDYDLSLSNVKQTFARENRKDITLKERAFLTILRNRVQRGGIMAPGAGLVKTGENNKGIKSRWYPETLSRRIKEIADQRQNISFFTGDGFKLIEQFTHEKKVAFFIDPPYLKAARRLYNNWQFDHEHLFELLEKIKSPFIVTYDDTEEIKQLAEKYSLKYRYVKMKNTHHAKKMELIISKNFEWFDAIPT